MIRFSAKYFDGESSRAHDVTVESDGTTSLCIAGLGAPLEHALSQVRISPRLGNTVRSLALPGGAKCETDDNASVDELERARGRGKGGAFLHRVESQWKTALFSAVLLVAIVAVGIKWLIPILAERTAFAIPDEMAFDLSRGTLATLDRTVLKPSRLPEARKAGLMRVFANMAEGYPDLPLSLDFRRGIGPNAFALPDGTIIATDELVELASNDEEVLAVLAHEIGHVHHRHSLRLALESSAMALLISTYLGDATQISALSTSLPTVYTQAHYSRDHEQEADSFAFDYLKQAGIPTHRFSDILRKLQAAQGEDGDSALQYIASHPPTAERIRRFERP